MILLWNMATQLSRERLVELTEGLVSSIEEKRDASAARQAEVNEATGKSKVVPVSAVQEGGEVPFELGSYVNPEEAVLITEAGKPLKDPKSRWR